MQMSEMPRATVLQGLAAATAAMTPGTGVQPSDGADWTGYESYETLSGEFDKLFAHVHGEIVWSDLEPDDFSEHVLEVRYDSTGIYLGVDGHSDTIGLGLLATLTDEQARDAAIALWQAAEEKEARDTGESCE